MRLFHLKNHAKLIAAGIGVFLSGSLSGQNTWTLQQCVDYALRNNITVKQAEINSEISKINRDQRLAVMIPSLNGSSSLNYNFGRSVDFFTNAYTTEQVNSANFSINSSLSLFNGFQLQHALAQSKFDYLASRENLKKISNDISLNVAAAYLQVVYANEALKTASDRVSAAEETRRRTAVMVSSGLMSKGNLLDAESALASEEFARVNAENSLQSALINLTQLLELKSSEQFNIASAVADIPDQSSLLLSPEQIFDASLKILPEFKVSEYNVLSAKKALSAARGLRSPGLSMFGAVNSGFSSSAKRFLTGEAIPYSDQIDENFNKSFGLSLSIPIFNGWSAHSGIKRSKLNVENAMLSEQITKNQVYKSIVQAHADANAALKRFQAAGKASDAAKESLSYAEKKYEGGLISFIEFINIRNNKSRAESDLLQSKFDLIFRLKVLDFYVGKPLVF